MCDCSITSLLSAESGFFTLLGLLPKKQFSLSLFSFDGTLVSSALNIFTQKVEFFSCVRFIVTIECSNCLDGLSLGLQIFSQ